MIAYFGHCVHVCVLKGLGPIAQYFIACKRPKLTHIAQILVAAGKGARIGGDIPKQYRLISGKAVLQRTLEATLSEPRITETVVVVADGDPYIAELISKFDNVRSVSGGATRTASVRAGLAALAANPPDLVLIHDGARPFVSLDVISGVIDALDDALPQFLLYLFQTRSNRLMAIVLTVNNYAAFKPHKDFILIKFGELSNP